MIYNKSALVYIIVWSLLCHRFINSTGVEQDLWCHMASPDHSELSAIEDIVTSFPDHYMMFLGMRVYVHIHKWYYDSLQELDLGVDITIFIANITLNICTNTKQFIWPRHLFTKSTRLKILWIAKKCKSRSLYGSVITSHEQLWDMIIYQSHNLR